MSSFLKFANIQSSIGKKIYEHNLNSNTITTVDFYRSQPVFFRHVDELDSFKFNISAFTRLSPQFKPLLGSARVVTRVFFVPYYQVMVGSNEFFTQSPFSSSNNQFFVIKELPYLTDGDILNWFKPTYSQIYPLSVEVAPGVPYDFHTSFSDLEPKFYKFTRVGRYFMDILVGLGYKVFFQHDEFDEQKASTHRNMLPLLSLFKISKDWFDNPNYPSFSGLDSLFRKEPSPSAGVRLPENEMFLAILRCPDVLYSSNYFTSAWDHPYGPNGSSLYDQFPKQDISMDDLSIHSSSVAPAPATLSRSSIISDSDGTPILYGKYGSSSLNTVSVTAPSISQYILDGLKAATDYVTRRHIVGNRTVDNFLALFGVKNPYEESMRSIQISNFEYPIQFGEVNATTSSDGQPLGDQAGKAVGFTKGNQFTFESRHQRGIIIGLSYVVPNSAFVDGIHRYNSCTKPLQFYSGDFDSLGVDAVRMDELCVSPLADTGYISQPDMVFGYMPRYAYCKVGTNLDILNGDFYHASTRDMYDRWHLFNNLTSLKDIFTSHSVEYTKGELYASQYHRIFADSSDNFDHFQNIFSIECQMYSPKISLWDSFDFHDDDKKRSVEVRVNGSQVND